MTTSALSERARMLISSDRASIKAATVSTAQPQELYELLTGHSMNNSGVPVTEHTVMMISAVYASVALIGGALASLPLHIYKKTEDGRDRYQSPLWWLFNESPWPNWTSAGAWQFVAQSIGLKGDAFQRIHRGVGNEISAIRGFEPIHPDRIVVDNVNGRNVYAYYDGSGTLHTVDQDDMLHFSGVGFDGKRSMSPIKYALKVPAGISLDADRFAGSFFKNGARPDFALKTPGKLDKEQADLLRNTWISTHQGPNNAHLPAVLTGGLEVQQLTMDAEDAQLLATRRFQIEDIARIFGVPPHMIGHTEKSTSWGSGVEQMSIAFIRYTMRRHLDVIQQEINRKVWPKSLRVFAEFNADALMDGDSKAQAEYFSKSLGGPGSQGWMTINEVRKLKNLKPVEGGDKLIFAGSKQENADASNDETTDPEQDEGPVPGREQHRF